MLKLQRNLCGPINIFFVTFHHFVVDKLMIVTFVLSLILLSLLDIYLPVFFFIFYFGNRGVRDERSVRSLTLPEVVAVSKEVLSFSLKLAIDYTRHTKKVVVVVVVVGRWGRSSRIFIAIPICFDFTLAPSKVVFAMRVISTPS